MKWSLGSLARASVRRAPMSEFWEAWGNAPNWRKGLEAEGLLRLLDSPSHTRSVIPGGSHSCVARFRFTG